jgi:hypothetical protein
MGDFRRKIELYWGIVLFTIILFIVWWGFKFNSQILETIFMSGWVLAVFIYIFTPYKYK